MPAPILAVGQKIEGPAIIEERETTTALPPGWSARHRQLRLHRRHKRITSWIASNSKSCGLISSASSPSGRKPCNASPSARSCARRATSPALCSIGAAAWWRRPIPARPGHINSLAFAGAHLVKLFDGKCEPGDVLITNDPWLSAGHFFDITLLTPIYDGDKILAYIGSTIHHTDIGGYGIGAGARATHEEGLLDLRRSNSTNAACPMRCCMP